MAVGDVAIGTGVIHGTIRQPLAAVAPAQKLRLVVGVEAANADRFENDWELWVFADQLDRMESKLNAVIGASLFKRPSLLTKPFHDKQVICAPRLIRGGSRPKAKRLCTEKYLTS